MLCIWQAAKKKRDEDGGEEENETETKDAAAAMEVEEKGETKAAEGDTKTGEAEATKAVKVVEPESFELSNPSRVTCSQKVRWSYSRLECPAQRALYGKLHSLSHSFLLCVCVRVYLCVCGRFGQDVTSRCVKRAGLT